MREQLWDFLDRHRVLNPNPNTNRALPTCYNVTANGLLLLTLGLVLMLFIWTIQKPLILSHIYGLISKLKSYGINGNLLTWIQNFLIGRQQCVVLNGSCSRWVNVTNGVPQGSVLGPLLFILYVNGITDGLKSTLEMFADDFTELLKMLKFYRKTFILYPSGLVFGY